MKKLSLILISILLIFTLAACGDKCEHTYDNACDAICNDCEETREVSAHQWVEADCDTPKTCKTCGLTEGEALGHNWKDADCVTAKTCVVCGATEGNALGHTPARDDGDCKTDVICTVCEAVTTPAKTEHIAHADDGDCTTPVTCTECSHVCIEAADAHNFGGEWKKDADGHWQVCQNENCTVENTKSDHEKGTDGKCTVCEYVVEVLPPHEHTYNVNKSDENDHWIECGCGTEKPDSREKHSATPDNDCATAEICSCGYTVTAAKDHIPGADDGNCETPIKCVNCDKDAKAGATGHHDADHDYTCDNAGCQVTVGNPPKDESDGIDLPIDTN